MAQSNDTKISTAGETPTPVTDDDAAFDNATVDDAAFHVGSNGNADFDPALDQKTEGRLAQWPLARGISWGLAVAAIGILGWALFELSFGFDPSAHLVRARQLLIACLVIQASLGIVLVFRIVGVWRSQNRALSSSRLFRRLIGFSIVIASAPAFAISATAVLVMTLGLQGWFGPRVGLVVDQALSTADSFLDEHLASQRSNAFRLGQLASETTVSFQGRAIDILTDRSLLNSYLSSRARITGTDSVMLFDSEKTVFGEGGIRMAQDIKGLVLLADLAELATEEMLVLSLPQDDTFVAIIPHQGSGDLYIAAVNAISPAILSRLETTALAASNFRTLSDNILLFQQLFTLLFTVLGVTLALFASWGGLRLAIELARPILRVTTAAELLGRGQWETRVPVANRRRKVNELDTLALTFNRMANDLGQQQSALKEANAAVEERRRFTEAVLAGVSAGVIGLDAKGNIDLPNDTASHLLDKNLTEWIGLPLGEVVPAFMLLLEAAHEDPTGIFSEEITITRRNGSPRQLLTNAVAEAPNGVIEGYVFTFDDVTDLQLAQRRAAWSDVARRIAHEIKNPLTPIQLSAERLKRRYLKDIENNPQLFSDLVDTIVRQVGEIGRMVDEFSGFARMPEPRMSDHDIRGIVRQAVFLQANAFAQVRVSADLPDSAVMATVDEQLLSQAIVNLVKNAAENIEGLIADGKVEEGQVVVQVLTGPDPEDDEINGPRIEVRDNGSGYPVELLPKLMEPYVTTREKGTGLGLAIVRKVMEDHHGELRLLNSNSQENLCGARAILLLSS